MNSPATTRAIFLAGMVFASTAFAGGDINKCVDASGHVTLTDETCPAGARTVKVIPGQSDAGDELAAADDSAAAVSGRYSVNRMPARYFTPMKNPAPARGLALDVATLKAARQNMLMLDSAAHAMRSTRIAGLQ